MGETALDATYAAGVIGTMVPRFLGDGENEALGVVSGITQSPVILESSLGALSRLNFVRLGMQLAPERRARQRAHTFLRSPVNNEGNMAIEEMLRTR